ncbi:MAG: hypothetical protein MUQ32_17015 [Chloroflexi bacterium]|nr:hypothetical protein [Chloroflexota bacterium]
MTSGPGPSLPLAETRIYRVKPTTRSWTEPVPFAIKTGEYRITGGCGGPGGAMVVLQRVRDGGRCLPMCTVSSAAQWN